MNLNYRRKFYAYSVFIIIFLMFFIKSGFSREVLSHEKDDKNDKITYTINRIDSTLYPTNFLNITIIGEERKELQKLKPEDFVVIEDGKEQKVLDVVQADKVEPNKSKMNVVLVIDTSGSMVPAMDNTREAAKLFIKQLDADDSAAIVSFSDQAILECNFTQDKAALESCIDNLKPNGATAFYMAVEEALYLFDGIEDSNRVVVVLTDGLNNRSGTLTECIEASEKFDAPVFTVGLGMMVDKVSLEKLAKETGGIFSFAATPEELEYIYKRLANALKSQLWVKYKASPQRWPKTLVQVTSKLNIKGKSTQEARMKYRIPLQWWKVVTSYLVVEIILIILTYFMFKFLWKKMNFDPAVATRFAIVFLFILTMIWYTVMFIAFLPLHYFFGIGLIQLIILVFINKSMGK
ncbi:MAG: vWA domain-containing protein [Vulcanimicrobiota bacterium]